MKTILIGAVQIAVAMPAALQVHGSENRRSEGRSLKMGMYREQDSSDGPQLMVIVQTPEMMRNVLKNTPRVSGNPVPGGSLDDDGCPSGCPHDRDVARQVSEL